VGKNEIIADGFFRAATASTHASVRPARLIFPDTLTGILAQILLAVFMRKRLFCIPHQQIIL
jgi:hypothetical protein